MQRYQHKLNYEGISQKEWLFFTEAVKNAENILIYGAGQISTVVVECLSMWDGVHIGKIAVTKLTEQDKQRVVDNGLQVYEIDDCEDYLDKPVLIATREVFHSEIFDLLIERGFQSIFPIYQVYLDRLIELYYCNKLKAFGIDIGLLDFMNTRRFFKERYQNKNNNFADMYGNIKDAMAKKATEEAAEYVVEYMSNAKCYEYRYLMFRDILPEMIDGLCLEFGVAGGCSTNEIATQNGGRTLYGFDSFDGLPEDWNVGLTGFEKGAGYQAELPVVASNVELVKGYFDTTLEKFMEKHTENVAFIYMDCTIFSSADYVFCMLEGRIVRGTIIVINSFFNYPGWKKNGEYSAFMNYVERNNIQFEYLGYIVGDSQVAVRIL